MKSMLKRIGIDSAGYVLILLALATGWLPGPGGIPLALAGLALLSLHNDWAKRLREWLIAHGAEFITNLFPKNRTVQLVYDITAGLLLVLVAWLVSSREAYWKIGLASGLFISVLLIIGMNRDRVGSLKRRRQH